MHSTFDQARARFLQGLEQIQADRLSEAEASFAAALALLPGRVSTLTNLGVVKLRLGKPGEAIKYLQQALAQQPDHLETLGQAAVALAELGRADEALQCLERSLELDATQASAWSLRGTLLRELGRTEQAIEAYRKALVHGADPERTAFYLAALGAGAQPKAPPPSYVESLFDDYAEQFEGHMQALNYAAPQRLVENLDKLPRLFERALDLGCGTGLCGSLLRGRVRRIDGVDLSARMVAKTRSLGLYQEVVQDDLLHYLETSGPDYDLVVAADVFIYVGALDRVFDAVARRLTAAGLFCFCVEAGEELQDYALLPSLRYVHAKPYLLRLAQQHGFEVLDCQRHSLRQEQGVPIEGIFAWLRRP